ncbi:molybdenum cofactor cytidylyltransferase [Pseudoduganella flava]|uniref:Molybdenum cofactor cytidylyltransferase n=1 Tax=Pseudoduganella flava TaxID=871742 RepID=A0A562PLC8_9BURK|nr:nucleotidyltransferase family protein [Pseudoduganella flava]QGZ41064.1 NTP transferase domain-containing protein [Pseudoduganella flava]TWI45234.1 molybdenum cofactor cytidylyltransferase [Pseudoduganella flava]
MPGIVGILLAAGRGRRFDPLGQRNKLLQPVDGGEAVVAASARHLLAALPHVVAVVRPDDDAVAAQLAALGCNVTVCGAADSGMAASLVHGLRQAPDAQGWLVALGDMPRVRPATIAALALAVEQGADIAVPVYQEQRGNPVAFGRRHLPQLLALTGDQGARGIVRNQTVNEVAVDDPGILLDVDTPLDLQ